MFFGIGTGLIIAAVRSVRHLYGISPKIAISSSGITFGNEYYPVTDISFVEMNGTFEAGLFFLQLNGAKIVLKNGSCLYITDKMYSNVPALKRALYAAIKGTEPVSVPAPDTPDNTFIFFMGVVWYNHRFLLVLLLSVLFIYLIVWKPFLPVILIVSALLTGLLFMIRSVFYYFAVSDNYLVVKSHWGKKSFSYPLANINEALIEQKHREPITLRIILNDYTTATFAASTLTSGQWRAMAELLKSRNVKVKIKSILLI